MLAAMPEEDDRRPGFLPRREERSEIGVGGDDDAILIGGSVEDCVVGGGLHAELADVHGVVPEERELSGDDRRERVVDQEPQPASGSSRSRTASAAYRSASWTSAGSRSG